MLDTRQQALITGFKAEHRELHAVLRDVEQAWKICQAGNWREPDRCRLCDAVQALKEHLTHHFAQEEAGGYMEEALTLAPRLAPTADLLLTQHPLLLGNCTAMAEQLRRGPADQATQKRLRDAYLAMRNLLQEHERGENAVMQEAYRVDLETV